MSVEIYGAKGLVYPNTGYPCDIIVAGTVPGGDRHFAISEIHTFPHYRVFEVDNNGTVWGTQIADTFEVAMILFSKRMNAANEGLTKAPEVVHITDELRVNRKKEQNTPWPERDANSRIVDDYGL